MTPTTRYLVFIGADGHGTVTGTVEVPDYFSLTDEALAAAAYLGLAAEIHEVGSYGYQDVLLSGSDLLDAGAEIITRLMTP